MSIEERVSKLEIEVQAYKMLADKALDMAMNAMIEVQKKPSPNDFPPISKDELLKEMAEVIVDEKVSPFTLSTKLITQKVEREIPSELLFEEGEG